VPFGGGSYEIRIKGRLSDSLLAAFEGLTATVEPVETVLHGPLQDQSSLHGLLDRIQSLGLELVEIRRLPGQADELPAGTDASPVPGDDRGGGVGGGVTVAAGSTGAAGASGAERHAGS
jgi:hypothetical protein